MSSWLGVDRPLDLIPVARDQLAELVDVIHAADVDRTVLDVVHQRVESLIAGRPMPLADALTADQQAAMAFAEQFVLDGRGFTDTDDAMLHARFTDGQLTTLTFAVAVFDAVARTHAVLGR
jgi:alkylhydroperoxidase family enzyme